MVGGANSAGQAAVYLSKFARSVTMLVRARLARGSRCRTTSSSRSPASTNITVRTCTEVAEVRGDGHLERLELRDLASGTSEIVDAGQLFIFIGAAPRTGWLDGVVARDERGFVLAGLDLTSRIRLGRWPLDRQPYHLETSVPGVFAVGRRAGRVGQAGRVGRGRGRHGSHVRAPVPGDHCDRRPTSPTPRRDHDHPVRPGRAAHAVPVREAHRRAAATALRRGPRGDHRAGPGLRRGRPRRAACTC